MKFKDVFDFLAKVGSLPARGAWIEIVSAPHKIRIATSLPARGAWIEIETIVKDVRTLLVAPRKGSVD